MWSQTHLMMEGELSLVKTDWNCLSKMSAFDLLSLRSVPLNFSGAVPMLSWRFDLMYLQNGLELFWASPSWMVLFTKFHSAWRKSLLHSFWVYQ